MHHSTIALRAITASGINLKIFHGPNAFPIDYMVLDTPAACLDSLRDRFRGMQDLALFVKDGPSGKPRHTSWLLRFLTPMPSLRKSTLCSSKLSFTSDIVQQLAILHLPELEHVSLRELSGLGKHLLAFLRITVRLCLSYTCI